MVFAGLEIIGMGLAVAAIMALLQFLIGRQRPKELAGDHGTLRLNHSMIGVAILIAWLLGCVAFFYHVAVSPSVLAVAVAICSLIAVPVMATAFSSAYDITWTTQTLTGPTHRRRPTLKPKRREVRFDDLVSAGIDGWGNYYVEDAAGTRIRWNWFYNGYPELMHFVEDVCPHLFPDLDADAEDGAGKAVAG